LGTRLWELGFGIRMRIKNFGFRRKKQETFWDMRALAAFAFAFWILDTGGRFFSMHILIAFAKRVHGILDSWVDAQY
jgi:hypothetical protein